MRFIKYSDPTDAVPIISQRLNQALHANQHVLWLVSGGSNIKLEAAIMAELSEARLPNLTILLMDERYGEWGHADSNFQQLLDAGFDPKTAQLIPTLTQQNLPMADTAEQFATTALGEFEKADLVIGLFGMGGDGHTAGIKPGSPATGQNIGLVSHYDWEDYKRITLTYEGLKHIDIAYLCVFGPDKQPALAALQDGGTDYDQQPSLILTDIDETIVINDQIGDTTV